MGDTACQPKPSPSTERRSLPFGQPSLPSVSDSTRTRPSLWAVWARSQTGPNRQAGLTAQTKGRRLGIFRPHEEKPHEARKKERGEEFWIELCGRPVPAKNTEDGIRAVHGAQVIEPKGVRRYLEGKFGDDLDQVRLAMRRLARNYSPQELDERCFGLYERFRPEIPAGTKGWGTKGDLDLGLIERLAKEKP